MTKRHSIRNLFPRATRTHRTPLSRRRPALEALEHRVLLSNAGTILTKSSTSTPGVYTVGPGASSTSTSSLRGAIGAYNTFSSSTVKNFEIKLSADTHLLGALGPTQEYKLTSELDINNPSSFPLVIAGAGTSGTSATIIDAQALSRVFQILKPGTNVEFDNLVIEDGLAQNNGTGGATTTALGGGILNNGGNLTFNNVVFASNTAKGGAGQGALGGAVYSTGGSVTLSGCTFTSNKAQGGQGGAGRPPIRPGASGHRRQRRHGRRWRGRRSRRGGWCDSQAGQLHVHFRPGGGWPGRRRRRQYGHVGYSRQRRQWGGGLGRGCAHGRLRHRRHHEYHVQFLHRDGRHRRSGRRQFLAELDSRHRRRRWRRAGGRAGGAWYRLGHCSGYHVRCLRRHGPVP